MRGPLIRKVGPSCAVDNRGNRRPVEQADAMPPILDPALPQLWRDSHTLQLGLAPDAPVVGGLDNGTAALLRERAAPTRETEALRAELARIGVPTDHDSTAIRGPLSADLAAATVLTGSRRAARDRLR